MKNPTRLQCLVAGWDAACPHPACQHHIPAVAGDISRRRPVCARAISDMAYARGGIDDREIAWLLGVSAKTVQRRAAGAMDAARQAAEGHR